MGRIPTIQPATGVAPFRLHAQPSASIGSYRLPAVERAGTAPGLSLPVLALSVVIVNYRSDGETRRLVQSLSRSESLRRGQAEVLVIDNGARAGSELGSMPTIDGVSLRQLHDNVGFGQAVNHAAFHSRGEWLLLLNPDVEVTAGFLDHAITFLGQADSRDGVIGLRLTDADGKTQPSVGTPPALMDVVLGFLRPRGRRRCNVSSRRCRHEVGWVSGCGMAIRRACFNQIGGFDPDYFLYYEDVDLSQRARSAGWNVVHDPRLAICHHHPLHTRPVPPRLRLLTRQALLTYARKHWSATAATCLALVVTLEAWVRRLVAWRNPADQQALVELSRLAWDGLQGQHRRAFLRAWRIAQEGGRDVRVP